MDSKGRKYVNLAVAERAVTAFQKEHARAQKLFEELFSPPKTWYVEVFCYNQKRWCRYKKCIKFLENNALWPNEIPAHEDDYEELIKCIVEKAKTW